MNDQAGTARTLCLIGCGPRGASIVERILANVPALYGDRPLDLHIVDPYPPGAGRVWRTDQPGLLWMNSAAEQVTMYPDASVDCAGPPRPGPTTAAWLGSPLHDGAYAARRDQGRYLRHFFETVTRERPASVRLFVHRARVTDLRRTTDGGAAPDGPGRQRVFLDNGEPPFLADRVVFAQGHTETLAAPVPAGLTRIGPGPADPDALERIPPGAPVVVRGLGLVFIDCLALLTEGRGGRFVRTPAARCATCRPGASPGCTRAPAAASRCPPNRRTRHRPAPWRRPPPRASPPSRPAGPGCPGPVPPSAARSGRWWWPNWAGGTTARCSPSSPPVPV